MKCDYVVPLHPRSPGRIDLRDDAALELESRIGRIVGIGVIGLSSFIDAFIDVSGAAAAHRLDLAEEIVEYVAPVRQHVENDSPTVGLAVVPRRTLRGLQVAFEHPVAELASDRQDTAEEARIPQHAKLAQSGKKQLVLYDAMLDPARLREARQ